MNRCPNAVRPGCRSALCRGAHSHLRRLTVLRHPVDDSGRPDFSAAPDLGWICALIGGVRTSKGASIAVPGIIDAGSQSTLTIAAGSFDPPLAVGDTVMVDGAIWQVCSVSGSGPFSARLVPGEEQ